MFCGIVTAVGSVVALERRGGGLFLRVACPAGWTAGAQVGSSIAVDGVCLTATEVGRTEGAESGEEGGDFFCADLTPETVAVCAPWSLGQEVNLERALKAGDEIGGHFVTGHVDGTTEVLAVEDDGAGGRRLRFSCPRELRGLLARKGSAAVAGVSLTVNDADADSFWVHLIPHTLRATNLGKLRVGARANVEADVLARHAARAAQMLAAGSGGGCGDD